MSYKNIFSIIKFIFYQFKMAEKKLCAGITKKGTPCKNPALPDSNYCWRHQDQETPYLSDSYINNADIFEYDGDEGDVIWGHGPFTIKVEAGRFKKLISIEIQYPEAKDYTLDEILSPIENFYSQKLSEHKIQELIKQLEEEKELKSTNYTILKEAEKFYADEKNNKRKKQNFKEVNIRLEI